MEKEEEEEDSSNINDEDVLFVSEVQKLPDNDLQEEDAVAADELSNLTDLNDDEEGQRVLALEEFMIEEKNKREEADEKSKAEEIKRILHAKEFEAALHNQEIVENSYNDYSTETIDKAHEVAALTGEDPTIYLRYVHDYTTTKTAEELFAMLFN